MLLSPLLGSRGLSFAAPSTLEAMANCRCRVHFKSVCSVFIDYQFDKSLELKTIDNFKPNHRAQFYVLCGAPVASRNYGYVGFPILSPQRTENSVDHKNSYFFSAKTSARGEKIWKMIDDYRWMNVRSWSTWMGSVPKNKKFPRLFLLYLSSSPLLQLQISILW